MANTGLGRGLGSLIPNKNNPPAASAGKPAASTAEDTGKGVMQLAIDKIAANPRQPRTDFNELALNELAASIKDYGVIQPLIVNPKGSGYELIAGERRLRASKIAGLKTVPAIVRKTDEQEKLELALIENIQREDLDVIELAHAYRKLIDEFGLGQEDVAKRVGKSRPSVTNILRMLSLPEEVQLALKEGKITEGHAKYLAGIEGEERQMNLFRKIVHNQLTVVDTGRESRRMGGTKNARIKINYQDKDKEFALREFFGTRVEVKRKGKGGQIIIEFFSEDELLGIVGKVK